MEEVAWRAGAKMLIAPTMPPESALREAIQTVYEVDGTALDDLTGWMIRGENAYFTRSSFELGRGPLSLEPLIWKENPAAAGPAIYLRDRMEPAAREAYAGELTQLKAELQAMSIARRDLVAKTAQAIDGTLADLQALARSAP